MHITPQRGNKFIAQGIAPSNGRCDNAPCKGNNHIAQGIALGNRRCNNAPCKGKSIIAEIVFLTLLNFINNETNKKTRFYQRKNKL